MTKSWLAALLVALPFTLISAAPIIREPGVIYVDDILDKPVTLTVSVNAPAYYDSSGKRYLGTLRKGQRVQLLAVKNSLFQVRGQAQQGQIAGWVNSKNLGALDKHFLPDLKKAAARYKQVKAFIAKKQVAINMTAKEVMESLGKPQKKTQRIDAQGDHSSWEYIRYKTVPQYTTGYDRFGHIVQSVIWIRVPNGHLTIVFNGDLISAIEQSEGSLRDDGGTQIVVAPIDFQD